MRRGYASYHTQEVHPIMVPRRIVVRYSIVLENVLLINHSRYDKLTQEKREVSHAEDQDNSNHSSRTIWQHHA